MYELIRWLTVCFVISMVMKPLFPLKSLRPADGGFCVSLGLGLGIVFTSVWFVCSVTGVSFDSVSCIAGLILFFITFLIKSSSKTLEKKDPELQKDERIRFLLGFMFFSLLFILAFWVKGFKPFIDHQTEQYMDFGFMKAMYRQKRVPFNDLWFAGKKVNYYYLGQAAAVFLCRLAFVTPEYGYNLMLCTIFASLGTGVFVLVCSFLSGISGMNKRSCVTGALMASLMCTFGGNGHWIIYGIIRQIYDKVNGITAEKYWFPTSTLFIGYHPDTLDKAKHEFPSYTLVLGDMHAHVCNMLFTIPFLILLIDHVLASPCAGNSEHKGAVQKDETSMLKEISAPGILIMGVILGLFRGVNYWDFPIYFVVSGAVILFCDIKRKGMNACTLLTVLIKGLIIYIIGSIVMLPFLLNYKMPYSGIHLCDRHSPFGKFIIIWFIHVIIVISLLIYVFAKGAAKNKISLTAHELIITAISLCGLGLLIMPELIYVKDIYGDKFQRYNTMFKLTFQGFILLSVSAGICIGLFINTDLKKRGVRVLVKIAGWTYCAAALMLSAYMVFSVRAWFGNVTAFSERKGISATDFVIEDPSYDNVREAISILNHDKDRTLNIIEEAGNSYKPENRLSVFTGASTVEGWYVHEWVWRNDAEEISKRRSEVKYFYSGADEEFCRELIKKYRLDYIYVGPETVRRYDVDYEGFKYLGEHVWESSDGRYMLIKLKE